VSLFVGLLAQIIEEIVRIVVDSTGETEQNKRSLGRRCLGGSRSPSSAALLRNASGLPLIFPHLPAGTKQQLNRGRSLRGRGVTTTAWSARETAATVGNCRAAAWVRDLQSAQVSVYGTRDSLGNR
jgi:hypothetical protein